MKRPVSIDPLYGVAYTADENSMNFEKRPPKKGIPARERRKIDSATATKGIFRASPEVLNAVPDMRRGL